MQKNRIYRRFLQVFAVSLATSGFGLFANTNIQAAGDIVWVTTGNSIGKYSTDGTTAIPDFITAPLPGHGYATYLAGILVSGPTLYVSTIEPVTWSRAYILLYHPPPYIYVIAALGNTLHVSVYSGSAPGAYTFNATTGDANPTRALCFSERALGDRDWISAAPRREPNALCRELSGFCDLRV